MLTKTLPYFVRVMSIISPVFISSGKCLLEHTNSFYVELRLEEPNLSTHRYAKESLKDSVLPIKSTTNCQFDRIINHTYFTSCLPSYT